MNADLIPLVSGLAGAVIGAVASVVGIWVQQHFHRRQERARLVVEAATSEYEAAREYARLVAENNRGTRVIVNDLGHYIALYSKLITLAESKHITRERWAKAYREATELADAAAEASEQGDAQPPHTPDQLQRASPASAGR